MLNNFKFCKLFKLYFQKKLIYPILIRQGITSLLKANFSNKDEAFWEEYMRRKAQGGKIPALESQEIILNKVIHSWKFAKNHSLSNEELLLSLRELEPNKSCPFVVLDVRENSELDLYKLPLKNKREADLPVIYREMNELNHGNYEGIPLSKYIICIDSVGLRGRMAARNLSKEGYLALYVEGGYDMFIPLTKMKEF